ncbi:MAG: NADH-quinone oxidoreductase subunit L [Alphaproteobacteria bacterium]|nr:NADH-quinone oxidoreductase subunit L [Alphaproteobacteria bacterium]
MEVLVVFPPLLGAIIAGLFGRWIKDTAAMAVTVGMMCVSAIFAVILFFTVAIDGHETHVVLFTWIDSGSLEFSWAIHYDTLTAVMCGVVSVVSTAIHVYSIGYMGHDPHKPRFFAYLSFFTFFMLMLVTADNLVQLFFGWEGVGLCSYLLIGFWYERPAANAAAIKAFVVNRIGDLGFLMGICGLFLLFDSVDYATIFAAAPSVAGTTMSFIGIEWDALTIVCLLLFIGAMGKSAQFLLHTWLPDAMEGPTPVSALIHAATMVTAGVFMVCRLSPVFEYAPDALMVVTIVGGVTCFFAATIGITQYDIKRVIAYSTCSQLGYMFFAAGVSAFPAAIFHLATHAFFKALLFLCSGSVIHAMGDEQDMRKMGGLWRKIPYTYAMMIIGSLALSGIPIFAGYYSKDMIIESAWGAHTYVGDMAFWLGVAAAALTALYSFRLIFLTFHGAPRMDQKTWDHVHESPLSMLGPLAFLSIGATFGGILGYDTFVGADFEAFWRESILILPQNHAMEAAHHAPLWVKLLPLVVGVAGIILAYIAYMSWKQLPGLAVSWMPRLHMFLFKKWYFDELYDAIFTRQAFFLGNGLWRTGDGTLINGLGPDGLAATTLSLARRAGRLQSGYVYHYAFAMLIGVVFLLSWYLFQQAG